MNISFFGSSLVSAYWNGAATYYRGIIRALHERGHRVTFYEPDAYERQQHRDIDDPDWARVVVYAGQGEDGVRAALQQARGADVIVKASGVGVFDALLESAVLELQTSQTLVAFWDVDAPATLDRVESDANDPFRACIPRYDLVLTYGGGAPVTEAYARLGAPRVRADLQRARSGDALPGRARSALCRRPGVSGQPFARPRSARRRVLFANRRELAQSQIPAGRERFGAIKR